MKKLIPWAVFFVMVLIIAAVSIESREHNISNEIPYSDFIAQVDRENVHDVIIDGNTIQIMDEDSTYCYTFTLGDAIQIF